MNTRNVGKSVDVSVKSNSENELNKIRATYNGKEIRKDSLLAKANMVKDFNEKNNKQ